MTRSQGPIKSSWTQTAAGITMNVTIPANTTAKVYVPGADPSKVGELGVRSGAAGQGRAGRVAGSASEQDAVVFNVGSGDYKFVVGEGLFKATQVDGGVGGTVPATLSLTLGDAGVVRRVHAGRGEGLSRRARRRT